jgi:type IV pilus assembly protein PilB
MAIDVSAHHSSTRSRPGRLLGDVLVDLGFCDRPTVEAIVRDARAASRPMQHLLIERGVIDASQLALAVAERFGLEYTSLEKLRPDIAAMQLVPESALRRLQAVPIGFRGQDTLIVAMVNPTNVLALDDLTMLTDLRVEPIVVSREDLDVLLQRLTRLDEQLIEPDDPFPEELAELAFDEAADDGPTVKLAPRTSTSTPTTATCRCATASTASWLPRRASPAAKPPASSHGSRS